MSDLELIIRGMSCRHCVRDITARLRDVPGVRIVAANARTSRVSLHGSMSTADVKNALAGTTFRVEVLPDVQTLGLEAREPFPRTAPGQREESPNAQSADNG